MAGRKNRLTKTGCMSEAGRKRSSPERSRAWPRSYMAEGKGELFATLRIFLSGGADPLPTYTELAARLATPASTLRSDVTRLRARYREALRVEVRSTVERESEVEDELRELLRVLTCR
ncbi:MAG: hypothetical protein ABI217_08215 [Chthoniobacterales bacterium]